MAYSQIPLSKGVTAIRGCDAVGTVYFSVGFEAHSIYGDAWNHCAPGAHNLLQIGQRQIRLLTKSIWRVERKARG